MSMRHGNGLTIAEASHRVQVLSTPIATAPPHLPAVKVLAFTSDLTRTDLDDFTPAAAPCVGGGVAS